MKKVIFLIGMVFILFGCAIVKEEVSNEELERINQTINDYFKDGKKDVKYYSHNFVNYDEHVVEVGIFENSEERQNEFKSKVVDSEHIKFVEGKIYLNDIEPPFKITLKNPKCDSKEKVIHTFSDGRKVISRCGDIKYNEFSLSEALDNYYIDIETIASKMNLIEGVYDGGTRVYEYKKKEYGISKDNFKLEICNKIDGSKDILFLSSKSKKYKCA